MSKKLKIAKFLRQDNLKWKIFRKAHNALNSGLLAIYIALICGNQQK